MATEVLAVYAKKLEWRLDSGEYLSLTGAIEANKFLTLAQRNQLIMLVRANMFYGLQPEAFGVPEHPLPAIANAPFLHRNLTLHLDLKPENILLCADGRAVLCDFGISRTLKTEQTHQTTMHVTGAPAYMDPALFNPENPQAKTQHSTANDVYSLGMVAASCVMLRRPYDGWDLFRIMFHGATGKRETLPENTKPKLAKLITMCWAQDQKSRPTAAQVSQSMQEIHREEIGNNAVTFPTKF